MFIFNFSMEFPIPAEKLFEILKNFTLLKELLPDQVKECEIIQQNKEETITKELLKFSTYFGNQTLHQETSHKIILPYTIVNETIEGPFKNSMLTITLEDKNELTKITLNGKCKIPLKYSLLSPIIQKKYKALCISMLYTINNMYNAKLNI
jgi:hypothetical protein